MYQYRAEIVRWVDGDTVDMVVDLGFKMATLQRFRLLGVNTPERGQPGFVEARQFCETRYPPGSKCDIRSHKPDSFGRWLCEIDTLSVDLIDAGLAVPYAK